MKKLLSVLIVILFCANKIVAQENIFVSMDAYYHKSKLVEEKINRFKTTPEIKNSEQLVLKQALNFKMNSKGIFNILGQNIEFEITKEFAPNHMGAKGFKADLRNGGYALISTSITGLHASIWLKQYFYTIESFGDGVYLVSEINLDETAINYCKNGIEVSDNLEKTTQNLSFQKVLTPAQIKVLVGVTPDVIYNYDATTLVGDCLYTTNLAFYQSLCSSEIDILDIVELSYTESGNADTDISRFMTLNDGYLDEIHSLRHQYGADVCVLLVNSLDANGIVPTGAIGAVENNAFCVVKASAAASTYSFSHELGHLLGG